MSWRTHAAGVALCAIISAVAVLAGYRPAVLAVEAARRDDLEMRRVHAEITDLESTKRALSRLRVSTEAEMASLAVDLAPAADVNERLATLAALAERLSIVIDELQPGRSESAELLQIVPFTMTGTATFSSCADFVHRLQDETLDMTVRAFSLDAAATGGEATARFRFEIVWFAAQP